MATILTKKKDTTGAPGAGDLTNAAGGAELAVNTADKRLYTKDSGGNVVEIGTNPSTFTVTSPKVITGINDTNNNELFKVTATSSAVNEFTVANAATGNGPTLSATGDDTNININITPKGTGSTVVTKLSASAAALTDPVITGTILEDVWSALRYTQMASPNPQIWVYSNAGNVTCETSLRVASLTITCSPLVT